MLTAEQEKYHQFIAEEMRQASRGSFPLSPGIMTGHYVTARLYWHFRRDVLGGQSVKGIFGKEEPSPPVLRLPAGHRHVSIEGLNETVWQDFLETAFTKRPVVDPLQEMRTLISVNALSDTANFDRRLNGEKSHIVNGNTPVPSLLRAFMYEDAFPERTPFFEWVLDGMRIETSIATHTGFTDSWSESLGKLVTTWNNRFPDNPFIPDKS